MGTQTNPNRLIDDGTTSTERTYALVLHLSTVLAITTAGILGVAMALVMWLMKKDESPFLDDHGREAVNFQLSLIIYTVLSFVLGCGVLFPVVLVLGIVGMILAASAANRGEYFRYPATIRLLH